MLTGLFAYGISLVLFIVALRHIGTARAGAYFSIAPFFGALLAIALGDPVTIPLVIAGVLMALGVWLHLTERHEHPHTHEPLEHDHWHTHPDDHHDHEHRRAGRGRAPATGTPTLTPSSPTRTSTTRQPPPALAPGRVTGGVWFLDECNHGMPTQHKVGCPLCPAVWMVAG